MDIDVILFDWGGTLAQVVGQEDSWRRGAAEAARAAVPTCGDAAIEQLIALVLAAEAEAAADPELREAQVDALLERWGRLLDPPAGGPCLRQALDIFARTWVGSLEPLPGALEAVRTLRRRGYRMGLVSNCMMPLEYSRLELDRQGFGPLLDFAVFSSQVGYRKPSPRIYEAALSQAFPKGRPADLSRVLFVGDSPAFDVATPAAMGMKTALVKCYKGIWPEEDYARARPDLRLDYVADLPGLLR